MIIIQRSYVNFDFIIFVVVICMFEGFGWEDFRNREQGFDRILNSIKERVEYSFSIFDFGDEKYEFEVKIYFGVVSLWIVLGLIIFYVFVWYIY